MCNDLEEKEDFQTVALDDEYWNTDPIPDRHLCIHEHSQPHSLCPYPASYCDTHEIQGHSDLHINYYGIL